MSSIDLIAEARSAQARKIDEEGRAKERARIRAIRAHSLSAKNPALADHLAFETGLSVEDALKILALEARNVRGNMRTPNASKIYAARRGTVRGKSR